MAIKVFINEPIGGLTDQSTRLWERAQIGFTLIRGQRGTSSIPFVVRPGDTYQPTVGAPLYIHEIVSGNDVIAYASKILTVERKWNGDEGLHIDQITAVSLEACFDTLRIDPPMYFTGMTGGQIITALFNALCGGVPVTLGDIDLTAGGILPDQVFRQSERLSDVFTSLATLASTADVQIIWGVRHSDSTLYWHNSTTTSGPFTITEYRYETGDWKLDQTDYRNRQLIQISFNAFSTSNQMYPGDGVSKLFRLPVPVDRVTTAMLTTGTQATATGIFGTASPAADLIPSPGDTFTITPPHVPPVVEDPYTWVASLDNRIRNQVLIGATALECAQNMADAINANPATAGSKFSLPTWENDACNMDAPSPYMTPKQVVLRVRNPGSGGNGVILTSTPAALSPFVPPAFEWEGGSLSPFVPPMTAGGTDGVTRALNVSVSGSNTLSTDLEYTPGSTIITTNSEIQGGMSLSVAYYRLGGDTIAVEDSAAVSARAAIEHGNGKYQQLITATQVADARAGYIQALQALLAYSLIPASLVFDIDRTESNANQFPTTGELLTLAVVSPTGASVVLDGNWVAQEIQATIIAGLETTAEPYGHFRYAITVINTNQLPTFVDFWVNLAIVSPAGAQSSLVPPVGGITSATPSLNPPVPTNTTPTGPPNTTGTPGSVPAGQQWVQEALGRYALYKASNLQVDASVNTRVSSVTRPAVGGDVGRKIIVISGTGWTPGEYTISGTTGSAWDLTGSPAATSTTGGVFALVDDKLWCTTYNISPSFTGNPVAIISKNDKALNPFTAADIGPNSPGGGDYSIQKANQILFASAPTAGADRMMATYFPDGITPAPVGPAASTFSVTIDVQATDFPQPYTPHVPPGGDRHFFDVQVSGGAQEAHAILNVVGTTDMGIIWSLISSDAVTTDPTKIGALSDSPNGPTKKIYTAPAVLPTSQTPPLATNVVVLGVQSHADGSQKAFNTISLTGTTPPPPTGNFVAIAFFSSSTVAIESSPDAAAWTARASATDPSGGACIAAGGGMVVALAFDTAGSTYISLKSTDHGVTWSSGSFPVIDPSIAVVDIIVVAGTFVAIDSGFNALSIGCGLYTSTDGVTWTNVGTIPATVGLTSFPTGFALAFGAGLYVAVGGTTDGTVDTFGVATSPDLAAWTYRTAPQPTSGTTWHDVIFAGGQFVAVGGLLGDAPQVIASADGITWSGQTSPLCANGSAYTGIAFGAGLYVVVSNDPAGITMTSPDGAAWTGHSVPDMAGASRVRFLNGLFVATISNPNNPFQTILTSPDGLAWTTQTTAIQDRVKDVAFG